MRVAVVTGAGSGIGKAISMALAPQCRGLTLVGRRAARLEDTAAAIRRGGSAPEILVLPADLSNPSQARSVAEKTDERFGRLDVLINNAAVLTVAPVGQTTPELLRTTFAANVFGPALLVAAAWPIFMRQASGCVVNVSSMATVDPFPGLSVYAASKAALESLTRSIASESGGARIRAFSLVLGAVETPMLRSVITSELLPPQKTLEPEVVARVVLDCVLGRRDADAGGTITLESP